MILYLGVGLVLLIIGAEGLVRGASALAGRAGIPPLLIGLTVVALGTSSPEVVVTLHAALDGHPDLVMGNVVGSNLFNGLFILGLAALFGPLRVTLPVIHRDVPLLIAASLLVLGLSLNGSLGRGEGIVLLSLAVIYTLHLAGAGISASRADSDLTTGGEEGKRIREAYPGMGPSLLLTVGGIAGLAWGASWVVRGASGVAETFGVPEPIVGLTVLAAGTSLPEVATALVAGLRGRGDLAVGSVVGSNLYNLFLVLGAGAVITPGALPVAESLIRFDLPFMLGAAVALLPFAATGHRIDRWEGAVFVVYWIAYLTLLVLEVMGHPVRDPMWVLFAAFLVPITLMTLVVVGARMLDLGDMSTDTEKKGEA